MKAVVLAAGKGTRLNRLTETTPKPMLPVGGEPIVSYLLEQLAKVGVSEIFMNLHHSPDVLRNYCGDGSSWGFQITYSYEPELLGTAGAVKNFQKYLEGEPFWVMYGDNYLECDLYSLWEFHAERDGVASIALFEREDTSGAGIAQLDDDDRVTGFVEKPPEGSGAGNLVNGGLYVLSPDIFSHIPAHGAPDFGYDIFPALLSGGHPIFGKVMPGEVLGIDTPERYEHLKGKF
ncbi:MAG: nucleotidyltransferase family protein [Nitrospinaceae bacterium]|nr:nucleotidyltransferase family protein [Nitrospinaceae bacterium]MBT5368219.1 nucleotidyltransferase family protein [Nitrospinaceae bacterium]MBT6395767.1 nucleotidyltransferase family protein [Nitrospinaceae bacterium]